MNVQAKGIFLEDKQRAQVSMNILNYQTTPAVPVFELVRNGSRTLRRRHRRERTHRSGSGAGVHGRGILLSSVAGLSRDALVETRIYE